jgi:hypothetical protein
MSEEGVDIEINVRIVEGGTFMTADLSITPSFPYDREYLEESVSELCRDMFVGDKYKRWVNTKILKNNGNINTPTS